MCTVLLPPGDNPIAVNKYINININRLPNLKFHDCTSSLLNLLHSSFHGAVAERQQFTCTKSSDINASESVMHQVTAKWQVMFILGAQNFKGALEIEE